MDAASNSMSPISPVLEVQELLRDREHSQAPAVHTRLAQLTSMSSSTNARHNNVQADIEVERRNAAIDEVQLDRT